MQSSEEGMYESCRRWDSGTGARRALVGVDGSHRFCLAGSHRADEFPLEADVEPLVRAGMGTNRWKPQDLSFIASLQLGAILLYVIPRTSVLGAVILTGYLGGAIASYVRIGAVYPPLLPLTTAMLACLGIYLRDKRLRQLLPFRTKMRIGN